MAIVKYGGGIVQMSGSIAGTTFARNRFGNYSRARTTPINPASPRQVAARATISYLTEYWNDTLTQVQRGLWDVYAAAVTTKNRLSDNIHLTGFNHFIRSNAVLAVRGQPPQAAAPTTLSLAPQDDNIHVDSETIATQKVMVHVSTAGWAADGDVKAYEHIYMGVPVIAGRNFFAGPWRWMGALNNAQGAGGFLEMNAPFAFALGQKFWVQARVETDEARVSTLTKSPPRTVEAD